MKSDPRCIFCAIVNDELNAIKVYDDSQFVAFMDKYPITTGHTLVLPRKHHENIFTMDDEEIGRLFSTVSFLAKAIVKSLGANGLNLGQNNGRAAAQIVPHVHVHIIPRYNYDSPNGRWPARNRILEDDLQKIAHKIKSHLTIKDIKAN